MLYTPSTLNIDLILWHTQMNVCAENVKSWFKSWVFHFTFQVYILPHTLNCICVSLAAEVAAKEINYDEMEKRRNNGGRRRTSLEQWRTSVDVGRTAEQ